MAIKYLNNVDFNGNEIQNVVVQNLATAPTNPKPGQLYFDSRDGEKKLRVYGDGEWSEAGEMTPEQILAKLLTVDGTGSGLDADKVDGKDASDFCEATTGTDILKGDGNGNTEAVVAADIVDTLGTTPVSRATADADGNDITDTYAPLESPEFTGTPTAPTAATGTDTTQIATTAFVKAAIEGITGDVIFKGIVNSPSTISSLTAYKAGWCWKVGTAGTYVGKPCEVGDMIYCIADYNGGFKNSDFDVMQGNTDGVVIGPDSSVDAHIVTFDGATGKTIKDSGKMFASEVTDTDDTVPTSSAVVDYAQPLDDDLTAIAELTGAGVPTRASDNTWSLATNVAKVYDAAITGDGTNAYIDVTHNLGKKYVSVSVYDSEDELVLTDVELIDTTKVRIAFSSAAVAAVTGGYHIVVVG